MNNSHSEKITIMMSACLLGVNCNYKGGCSFDFTKDDHLWSALTSKYNIIPICPEQRGGLPTPRIPSELVAKASEIELGKGKILSKTGTDVTANFVKGAIETVRLARLYNVQLAVLKSKSPSCGTKTVYDGSHSGILVDGQGYTAYLLNKAGIRTIDEAEFCDLEKCTLSDFKVK